MNKRHLACMTAVAAVGYLANACGGGDDEPSGSAGSSGASNSAGNPGTGGSAGSGATAGNTSSSGSGGGGVTVAECVSGHFSDPAISAACKDCMCQCNARAASMCDENCWALTRCVQESCAGETADLNCIASTCSAFFSGATAAAGLAECFTECGPASCTEWFATDPGSGGAGGGGASSAGAAGTPDSGGTGNQAGAGGDTN